MNSPTLVHLWLNAADVEALTGVARLRVATGRDVCARRGDAMKPTPPHHKRIRVPFSVVAKGYGGTHLLHGLPGLWQIIGADPDTGPGAYAPWPAAHGTIGLIVAPARGAGT
jgi:hypothetical protein